MTDDSLHERMREDWNRRAREDAEYYVAFGRHEQDDREFFASAHEVVYGLEYDLRRLSGPRLKALEIGCGPGRLMYFMSRHFGEIHGVDVSDEMLAKARAKLASTPNAHVHLTEGSSLAQFPDESFDMVYSYAVFQHIPSREVVLSYLLEARRVLKTGGLLWFQVNGMPQPPVVIDTWSGVRFTPQEILQFARDHDFQVYTLEGAYTQYMWTSWRKRPDGWNAALPANRPPSKARVIRISNPYSHEPVVPNRGRLACASVWVDDLPEECGLNHLELLMEGTPGTPNYISVALPQGQQQINVLLPAGIRTGLVPVKLNWAGAPLCPDAVMRVIPAGPRAPKILSVTDAIDLMAGTRILNDAVKVTVEELDPEQSFEVQMDGRRMPTVDVLCVEPRAPRHELTVRLGNTVEAGMHHLELRVGLRRFPPIAIEVVKGKASPAPF